MGSKSQFRTVGLSPKLIVAVLSALATYVVTQTVMELPPWAVVVAQAVVIAAGVYSASPGEVVVED